MQLLLSLILVPLLTGLILLTIRNTFLRKGITFIATGIIAITSIALLIKRIPYDSIFYSLHSLHFEIINSAILISEIGMTLYLIYTTIKHRKYIALSLVLISSFFLFAFEYLLGHTIQVQHAFFIDKFSIVMVLIIGIIGSLIAIYALDYMISFHQHHPEIKDRTPLFFSIIFIFLSAMFGLIFSNNLLWLFFFWEVTTLCSFWLIGYKQNEESIQNAFRALTLNMVGGLAFVVGIIFLYLITGTVELNKMISFNSFFVLLPAVLFSIAGLTKSAQMPFSSWLLGAMVAPTPVSALLHSSTMVKAGVYLILRMSPILLGTISGFIIALIGGITFLITSFIAISQRDAKKILAYSTIANLGLIVACAGIGTHEAVWAGIMLIVFHAIAKCLLFLCVGTVEHSIGSRDVEDMDGLIVAIPRVAQMMVVGMVGMFCAPFGMLISKWAVLETFIKINPILAFLIIFGSAPTMFFWVKWMGKLLSVPQEKTPDINQNSTEIAVLISLSALTIGVCAGFPLLSHFLVEPYILSLYGTTLKLAQGNIIIMLLMLGIVLLFPIGLYQKRKNVLYAKPYLCGANLEQNQFKGSAGTVHSVVLRNYYLDNFCNEQRLNKIGNRTTKFFLFILVIGAFFLW